MTDRKSTQPVMSRPLTAALVLALLTGLMLAASSVHSADRRPSSFTAEERSQFVEEPTRNRISFPAMPIPNGTVVWRDSSTVMFSAPTQMPTGETLPVAVVQLLSIPDGTRTLTELKGALACSDGRVFLLAKVDGSLPTLVNPRLTSMTIGSVATLQEEGAFSYGARGISKVACQALPARRSLETGELIDDEPLRGLDGTLRVTRAPSTRLLRIEHVAPGMAAARLPDDFLPLVTTFEYLPWLGSYWVGHGTRARSLLWRPGLEAVSIAPPELLVKITRLSEFASGSAAMTRVGPIWIVKAANSFWRLGGIFLRTSDGVLRRVDDSRVVDPPGVAVSPGGCRIFYFRRSSPMVPEAHAVPTVIDLCEET